MVSFEESSSWALLCAISQLRLYIFTNSILFELKFSTLLKIIHSIELSIEVLVKFSSVLTCKCFLLYHSLECFLLLLCAHHRKRNFSDLFVGKGHSIRKPNPVYVLFVWCFCSLTQYWHFDNGISDQIESACVVYNLGIPHLFLTHYFFLFDFVFGTGFDIKLVFFIFKISDFLQFLFHW